MQSKVLQRVRIRWPIRIQFGRQSIERRAGVLQIGEGDSELGTAAGKLLAAGWTLAIPIIKRWFAENYLQEKWAAEARAMVVNAIEARLLWFNSLILSRLPDIQKEKAAGRQVILHIVVDTESVDTDYGPAQIHADVFS
jgi:hypothetical protein